MRSVVLLCVAIMPYLTSADDSSQPCRSWWSVADGVRHCLSGTGVNQEVQTAPSVVDRPSLPQPESQVDGLSDEEMYSNTPPSPDELPEREE